VFNKDQLANIDLVVWNNNSGDVLTLSQRKAFEDYINQGGGFLGIHGSGGDSMYTWDFYRDKLIGEQFIGHPGGELHFQFADVQVEESKNKVAANLDGWNMKDEWYSFSASPRSHGVDVVLTLDEKSYQAVGYGGQVLAMGDDHPIAWSQCIGKGRSFYTAIGHRPEVYYVPENLTFLKQAMVWAAGQGENSCR
jgi:type 1 glutamine amidotransferase